MERSIVCKKQVNIRRLVITAPVKYGEEDIPNNFPGRDGESAKWIIDLDAKCIENFSWPTETDLHMKVTDGGCYVLLAEDGEEVCGIECDYVPSGLGEFGDYIVLSIAPDGRLSGNHCDLDEAVDSIIEFCERKQES